jgi:beta-lactamase class D
LTAKRPLLALLLGAAAVMATTAAVPAHAYDAIRCTVMLDAASGKVLAREGRCGERVTPASTFKVALSLMGYDSGILVDAHTPALPFKEGYVDWIASWRAPTDPARWMSESVVWYSQQVFARLGRERVQRYVDRFGFGNRDLSDSRHRDELAHSGLSLAWINSSLAISADEQVAFLRRLVKRELGVTPAAYDMTARITRLADTPNGWEVHGKTGSGAPVLADGRSDGAHAYGWFVGWASKGKRTVVFARLYQDARDEGGRAGLRVRDAFLDELPARLAGS